MTMSEVGLSFLHRCDYLSLALRADLDKQQITELALLAKAVICPYFEKGICESCHGFARWAFLQLRLEGGFSDVKCFRG